MPTKNDDGVRSVDSHLDFQAVVHQYNLPDATLPQSPVTLAQLTTSANTKQDNLTAGDCIKIENNIVSLDIGSTGTDHSVVTISNLAAATLLGEYALAPFKGHIDQVGSFFDLIVGGNHNVYYKEVTPSSWAVLVALESGGNYYWHTAVTTYDPSSITQDISQFFPPFSTIDASPVTNASEQDVNGDFSPSSASDVVTYSAGGNAGGIIVQNAKAVLDWANTISQAASTKVFPSSVIKQYVDEENAHFADSSNVDFSNSVANLTGNPSKVQAAIEALKVLADNISTTVSQNQTTASYEYLDLDNVRAALGSTIQHMGLTHASLSDNSTAKGLINELAALIESLDADTTTTLGTALGATLAGVGGSVPDGLDVKGVLGYLAQETADIQSDQFSRLPMVHYYHHAAGVDVLTAGQVAGTEAFDTAKYALLDEFGGFLGDNVVDLTQLTYDARILVDYGIGGHVDAGVWVRDHVTGFLTRATYFDEAEEITKGAHMKVMYGGVIAGADFVIVNENNPVVGIDAIEVQIDDFLRIGDGTITKAKLDTALKTELHARPIFVTTQVDVDVAEGNLFTAVIDHTYGTKISGRPVMFNTATGEVKEFEVFILNNQIKIVTPVQFSDGNDTALTVQFSAVEEL